MGVKKAKQMLNCHGGHSSPEKKKKSFNERRQLTSDELILGMLQSGMSPTDFHGLEMDVMFENMIQEAAEQIYMHKFKQIMESDNPSDLDSCDAYCTQFTVVSNRTNVLLQPIFYRRLLQLSNSSVRCIRM